MRNVGCIKEFSQWGCSISELLGDHERAVKTGDAERCGPIVREDGVEVKPQWAAYRSEGDDSIYICPFSCRWPFETAEFIAERIVHELMHFCQDQGDLWLDWERALEYQYQVEEDREYYADQAAYTCRNRKKSP